MTTSTDQPTCLITGGARGIGAATAVALAKIGWRVVINYRQSQEQAEALLSTITNSGGKGLLSRADVANREEVKQMAERLAMEGVTIDCVVHNAAAPFLRSATSREAWPPSFGDQIATSCEGFFNVIQEMRPTFRKGCKVIALLSSALSIHDGSDTSAYLAGKGALYGLCRGWNKELCGDGGGLVLVSPVATITDLLVQSIGSHPRKRELFERTLSDSGTALPSEIAEQIAKVISRVEELLLEGSQPPHVIVDKDGVRRLEPVLSPVLL